MSFATDELAISDRELLARFAAERDQQAFATLVSRYGPLVMGVCRRVLRNTHEAEEAFQAAFLVLARKAGTLTWQTSITSWMYSVAYRTAMKQRSVVARRKHVEREAVALTRSSAAEVSSLSDLAEVIDAELARLPDKLRAPLVLCHIEGLSRTEAAERLGLTVAAVKDQLERGREVLRTRLTRRGVTLGATFIAGALATSTASAAVPSALVAATVEGATAWAAGNLVAGMVSAPILALAEGVLKPMFLEKLRLVAVFVISLLTVGTAATIMLADTPDRFASGIRGEVVAVDTVAVPATMTIKLDELDALVNFDVKADAKVVYAYQQGELGHVAKGTFVALRLAEDHRTVVEIQARGDVRVGEVESFDPAARQLTLLVDHDDEEDTPAEKQRFAVSASAQTRIDGRSGLVADIEPGMQVRVEFSRRKDEITGIEAQWTREDHLRGDVLSVDVTNETLLVATEIGDNDVEVSLPVVRGGKVTINGAPGQLADLKRGAEVSLRMAADRKAILMLRAVQRVGADVDDDE